jgi:hypothetical protein
LYKYGTKKIRPIRYLINEASAAGSEPSRYLTRPITVTKQSPEINIHNNPKEACFVELSKCNFYFSFLNG